MARSARPVALAPGSATGRWTSRACSPDAADAPAKPASQWSVAGRSAPRIDLPDKVTGRPRFLHDLVLPGMVFGRVIRPPGPAATLDDVGPANLPDGVLAVVRDGSFLGVLASQDRIAVTGRRAAGPGRPVDGARSRCPTSAT